MIDLIDLESSYKFYRTNGGKMLDRDRVISLKMYKRIMGGLMQFIVKKVLDGYDVTLGDKLGIIGVRGDKVKPLINDSGEIKGIAPNWGETKKLQARDEEAKKNRTIVYCFNEHSNGIKYRLLWYNRDVFIPNKVYYSLIFFRNIKRQLSKLVQEGKEYHIRPEKIENNVSNNSIKD